MKLRIGNAYLLDDDIFLKGTIQKKGLRKIFVPDTGIGCGFSYQVITRKSIGKNLFFSLEDIKSDERLKNFEIVTAENVLKNNATIGELVYIYERPHGGCEREENAHAMYTYFKEKSNDNTVMKAYFSLETWLYGDGKDKPLEIKSAMLWGGLMVAHKHGDISWDQMREMYGEYISKAMNLR
ncbi:MAG: hypothetical protein K0R00_80 [Herbinix sp.]|jgi:hypothetical protein|nr:hypothetical protein [Herbinix sp.]